jgi:hypothetical protein
MAWQHDKKMTASNISSAFMFYQGFLPGLPAKNLIFAGFLAFLLTALAAFTPRNGD